MPPLPGSNMQYLTDHATPLSRALPTGTHRREEENTLVDIKLSLDELLGTSPHPGAPLPHVLGGEHAENARLAAVNSSPAGEPFPLLPMPQAHGMLASFDALNEALQRVLPGLRVRGSHDELRALAERIVSWSQTLAENATAAQALLEAGHLLLNECGDFGRAIQVWREAISLDPESRDLARRVHDELARRAAWEDLEALLATRTCELGPAAQPGLRYAAWCDLGYVRAAFLGDIPGAVRAFRKASRVSSTRQVHAALAHLYSKRGEDGDTLITARHFVAAGRHASPERALTYVGKALEYVPNYAPALALRSSLSEPTDTPAANAGGATEAARAPAEGRLRTIGAAAAVAPPTRDTRDTTNTWTHSALASGQPAASPVRLSEALVDTLVVRLPRPRPLLARLTRWVFGVAMMFGACRLSLAAFEAHPGLGARAQRASAWLQDQVFDGLARYAGAAPSAVPSSSGVVDRLFAPVPATVKPSAATPHPSTRPARLAKTHVALLDVRVKGARLSRSQLTRALHPARDAASRCLERVRRGAQEREFVLTFRVRRHGHVAGARRASGPGAMTAVADCALRALRKTRFARPQGRSSARVLAVFGVRRGAKGGVDRTAPATRTALARLDADQPRPSAEL